MGAGTGQRSRAGSNGGGDSMSSNVNNAPIPIPSILVNVTGSRAVNTNYQNLTSRPLFVAITLRSSAAGANTVYAQVGKSFTTIIVGGYGQNATVSPGRGSISFWVLPGYLYALNQIDGPVEITSWIELQ